MIRKLFCLSILLSMLWMNMAMATTVSKLTFDELVANSALIIEAEVAEVSLIENDGLISSRVEFTIRKVLKGEYDQESLSLDYLGGESKGKKVVVSGQDIPKKGDAGFYFIENLDNLAVNPLTGWSQGQFIIMKDLKGNEYLKSDIQQELVEISSEKNTQLATKLKQMKFSKELIEEAYYTPATPAELRHAVEDILSQSP